MIRLNIPKALTITVAAAGMLAVPAMASANSCAVVHKTSAHRVVHKTAVHRPVAVAAYRETAPVRTVVETSYVHVRPRVVVVHQPVYYRPAPVIYRHYVYERPHYHHHFRDFDDRRGLHHGYGYDHHRDYGRRW